MLPQGCESTTPASESLLIHNYHVLYQSVRLALCVHLFGLICINSYQFVMICIDSVPAVIKQYQGDLY